MKVGLIILSQPDKVESLYNKISSDFKEANKLITTQNLGDLEEFAETVKAQGTSLDKIVVINIKGGTITNPDKYASLINTISENLNGNQTIHVCDKNSGLEDSIMSYSLESDKINYTNLIKITSKSCYGAVFGRNEHKVSNEMESTINNIIKSKQVEETVTPTVEESEDAEPVAIAEEPEEKKSFFSKIFKKKSKPEDTVVTPDIDDDNDDNDNGNDNIDDDDNDNEPESTEDNIVSFKRGKRATPEITVTEESEEPKEPENTEDTPIIETDDSESDTSVNFGKNKTREKTISKGKSFMSIFKKNKSNEDEEEVSMPVEVTEDDDEEEVSTPFKRRNQPVMDDDDDEDEAPIKESTPFKRRSQSEDSERTSKSFKRKSPPVYEDDDDEDEAPKSFKRRSQPVYEDDEEDEPVKSFKGKSAKNKINKPLTMVKKPRIVMVTGMTGSGTSTLTACLGYTAALNGVNTLIIDFDIINRTQSVIYTDDDNPEGINSSGLISALKSPHLLDSLIKSPFEGIDTLGINIADDNQGIAEALNYNSMNPLICSALRNYNMVICDMPWDLINKYPDLVNSANVLYYVTSNDLLSMINSINQFSIDNFNDEYKHSSVISRMEFIINKFHKDNVYDDTRITASNFSDIIADLSDEEMYRGIEVAGVVPYESSVGNQGSKGIPASAYNDVINNCCLDILRTIR